jgi:hypothetical protein
MKTKRLLLLLALVSVLALAGCATTAYRVDPACPDNLVLQNGEELPGLLLDVRNGEIRYLLLSGQEKVFPAAQVVRVDLGRRVGDPSLARLHDLRDREVVRLIEENGRVPAGEEYPSTMLLDETTKRLEQDQVFYTWRRLERINTRAGLDDANVTFTYNKLNAEAKVDFGYAFSPDGKVSILSAGSVKDSALGDGRADGSQLHRLQIAIPGGAVGGFVYFQFSTVTKLKRLFGFFQERTFAYEGPTKIVRAIVDVPEKTELNIFESNLGNLVTKTDITRGGRRVLVYEAHALPRLLSEPMMASWKTLAPFFAVGLKKDWPTLAKTYYEIFKNQLGDNEAVIAQAKKLTAGKKDFEAAAALYAFVLREVQDNDVDMWDRDGLPKTPGATLADRRGSGLDRTVLLYAMAKAVGLPVRFCLLRGRTAHAPVEQVPHLPLLNEPVLRFDFPAAQRPIWTTLGNDNRVFGSLADGFTDSFYLDLASGQTGATNRSLAADNVGNYVYDIYLQPDGSARIVEEHRLTGDFALKFRGYRHLEAEQLRDRMTRDVRAFAFRNTLVEFSIDGMPDLRDPIVLRRVSESPMFAIASGGKYSLIRLFDLDYGDLPEVNAERLYPFERAGLDTVVDVYRFHLPPGTNVEAIPPAAHAESPWCVYDSKWTVEQRTREVRSPNGQTTTITEPVLTYEDRTVFTQTAMSAAGFTAFRELLKARREAAGSVVLLAFGPATTAQPAAPAR